MRDPGAAPTALSSPAPSAADSCVWPGVPLGVDRNALAPSSVAGETASAPACFGRSSAKPTKTPLFPPETAAGATASDANAAAAATRRRITDLTPSASYDLWRIPCARDNVAELRL